LSSNLWTIYEYSSSWKMFSDEYKILMQHSQQSIHSK
jgi:hypothetical protein